MKRIEEIDKLLQEYVNECIKSGVGEFKIPFISMNKAMCLLNITSNDDFDSNGWQADMWESGTAKDGTKYKLHGSGYYGGIWVRKVGSGCGDKTTCVGCEYEDDCDDK